jgi:tRNA (guanine37-N1)-methyltransferase
MHFHIITLFPEMFDSYLGESIVKRALDNKKIQVSFYNPREFVRPRKKTQIYQDVRVDKRPYGGGPGMVLQAEPVLKAVEKALGRKDRKQVKVVFFHASGKQFDTTYADKTTKKYKHIIMICGRYEGVDARVQKILKAEPVSIGPYTLTGGELPAMLVLDSITRRIPGFGRGAAGRREGCIHAPGSA